MFVFDENKPEANTLLDLHLPVPPAVQRWLARLLPINSPKGRYKATHPISAI